MTREEAINRLNELFPYIREYQKLAKETCDIQDIFQDNGGKLLQVLLTTGLINESESREGNDAKDENGREYELKSVNTKLTTSFSTNHHLTKDIINKYRKVDWVFAVYEDIELISIYLLHPADLEPYYTAWDAKINAELLVDPTFKGINNPKIPLKYVKAKGTLIYKIREDGLFYAIDPSKPIEIETEPALF